MVKAGGFNGFGEVAGADGRRAAGTGVEDKGWQRKKGWGWPRLVPVGAEAAGGAEGRGLGCTPRPTSLRWRPT